MPDYEVRGSSKIHKEGILKTVREQAMTKFESHLDKILNTWDGQSLVDIVIKFSIVPFIQFQSGESRTEISTEKLRFLLTLLRTAPMKGITQVVKWVVQETKSHD